MKSKDELSCVSSDVYRRLRLLYWCQDDSHAIWGQCLGKEGDHQERVVCDTLLVKPRYYGNSQVLQMRWCPLILAQLYPIGQT